LQVALQHRESLLARLRAAAPTWAELIQARQSPHDSGTPPSHPAQAWRWRQIEQELERRASDDVDGAQRAVTKLREQLRQVTTSLVDTRAWLRQLRSTDPVTHSALVGWADLIRRIGKGTGKRVPRLREEARQRLEQARSAVPVWIMPLARVFETCDFRNAQFDVVILDEASQCDVLGLLCLLLARRVIVVGDHEQVSPSAVGERQDQVQALIDHHLEGIPNNLLYDGKTSIYDLARQSFGGAIRLVEHFRCVPEIIQFSNQLCYGGEIKPLREASRVLLRPHVVAHAVPWGCRDGKVNQGEAKVVASLLLACLAQPEYRRSTFGVVSLLGEEQALVIDQLLRAQLQPEEYRSARILCGTAAHFQGDERDVMFLSMVDSTGEGPLALRADAGIRQRYNVAASRARDQLWVVHSLRPTLDLKGDDLRLALLRFAEEASTRKREVEEKSRKTESEFERLVLRNLIERGFRVTPQWAVGAYRIDMVIQGSQARVALECDGDRYHGSEQLAQDLERQEILERLGWRFIRVRGSQFFRDPPKTMDWLVGRLAALDIEPVGMVADAASEDGAATDLHQRVLWEPRPGALRGEGKPSNGQRRREKGHTPSPRSRSRSQRPQQRSLPRTSPTPHRSLRRSLRRLLLLPPRPLLCPSPPQRERRVAPQMSGVRRPDA